MSVIPEATGAIQADALGGIPSDQVNDQATPSDSPPDTQADAQPEAPAPTAEKVETPQERGPVPYTRFEEVIREKQTLASQLQSLGQLDALYKLAQTDPGLAAKGFLEVSKALGNMAPATDPGIDESLMTDTERVLYQKVQALEGRLAQTARGTAAMQEAIADRDLGVALNTLGKWAADKGFPYDEQKVLDSMESVNVEGLLQKGKSVEEVARIAYKAAYFDEVPSVVKKQTYETQAKKAGASLGSAASKGGESRASVGSVRDAVDAAWRKLGLPEP